MIRKCYYISFIVLLLFQNQLSAQVFELKTINSYFKNKDTSSFYQFLIKADKNAKIGEVKHYRKKDIDTILSLIIQQYTNGLQKKFENKQIDYSRHIVLRPYVLFTEVPDFDVDTIIRNAKLFFENSSLISSKDFFSFSNFYPITKQATVSVDYHLENSYFKPLKLLQGHIFTINAFLRGASFAKDSPTSNYKKRLSFFGKALNTINTGNFLDKEKEQIVSYDLEVEKIIFNQKGDKAIVQCIYSSGSNELYFQKQDGRWTLSKKWDLLIID